MGLYGPPAAELLVWEKNYFTVIFTTMVGLSLYSYDTWYWWVGQAKMMKTPGGSGTTLGLFLYWGQFDLFSWIKWPMRVTLIITMICTILAIVINLLYRNLQTRMDYLVTPQRLEDLASSWIRGMGIVVSQDGAMVQRGVIATGAGAGDQDEKETGGTGILSRNLSSKSSLKGASRAKDAWSSTLGADVGSSDEKDYLKAKDKRAGDSSTGLDDNQKGRNNSDETIDKDSDKLSTVNEHSLHPPGSLHLHNHRHHHHISPSPPPPTFPSVIRSPSTNSEGNHLQRTMSERIRYAFLGWKSDGGVDGNSHLPNFLTRSSIHSFPPEPSSYTPRIENLVASQEILKAINVQHFKPFTVSYWQIPLLPFITMRVGYAHLADAIYCAVQLPFAYFKYGFRPRLLLALMAHGNVLRWTRNVSWARYILRAVRHPVYQNKSVKPNDILLASRISLSLDPPPKPTRTIILFWAYLNFTICSLLVIGTELAIQWNKIQKVQSITSVGQLIPAAIGVGGLAKVLYTALYEKDAEIDLCFGRCRGILRKARWRDASEWYARAAGEWERRRETSGSPMEKEEADKKRERERKAREEVSKVNVFCFVLIPIRMLMKRRRKENT
jgi:hypothetical protein